ncbi:MAG: signal peptidase I [Ilumatobacteraceae bacterium]
MSRKRDSKPAVSAARRVADFGVLALTVLAAWFLWPSSLGGSSRFIKVQGYSMEPTYQTGDLVMVDTDATPEIGDIIVFAIPDNEPGAGNLVVHRLIGEREDGTLITQGDNTESPDSFGTKRSDIIGSPRLAIPQGGRVLGMMSSPVGLSAASGMLITILLWPRKKPDESTEVEDSTEADEPTIDVDRTLELEAPVIQDGWSTTEFSAQVAAEAEEWLQSQLVASAQVP